MISLKIALYFESKNIDLAVFSTMILNTLPIYLQITFVILLGLIFYSRKSITFSGLVALVGISYAFIITSHSEFWMLLAIMFVSSSVLSKTGKSYKDQLAKVHSKNGPRDYIQALSNFGPGIIFFVIWYYSGQYIFQVAFIASIAASCADTWASEVGMLSTKAPRSIVSFKPMMPGLSGGVSLSGTLGGVIGALFIALSTFYCFGYFSIFDNIREFVVTPTFIATFSAGVLGFLFDSLLGSSFQALYQTEDGKLTEKEEDNTLIKGLRWLNNDWVNFISTLWAGIMGMIIYALSV